MSYTRALHKSEQYRRMFRVGLARSTRTLKSPLIKTGSILAPSSGALFTQKPNFVRFNSSQSAPSSEIKDALTSFQDPANIPEQVTSMTSDQIGYLESIGLGNGYGPTALVEHLLEYTHVYTGLPWWGTIVAATVAVRLVLFPLYVKASANGAKMSHAKPELDVLTREMREAANVNQQSMVREKQKGIMKKYDVKLSHMFLPFCQFPIAYGFYRSLRTMAEYPVDGFSSQGYAWFQDLSVADPYLGLHVISAGMVMLMMRLGGETGGQTLSPFLKKAMYFLPIFGLAATMHFPAAVVVYFAANSIFSSLQSFLLKNKTFRKWRNLPDFAKPKANPGAPKPAETFSEWKDQFMDQLNQGTENKVRQNQEKAAALQKRKNRSQGQYIKKH